MAKVPDNVKRNQQRYVDKQREAGMVRVSKWVPEDMAEQVHTIVDAMTRGRAMRARAAEISDFIRELRERD